jgi:hypothetical protein
MIVVSKRFQLTNISLATQHLPTNNLANDWLFDDQLTNQWTTDNQLTNGLIIDQLNGGPPML